MKSTDQFACYKLYTRIIANRLESKLNFYQLRKQAGFRSDYGTNDQLQCLKTLIEKTFEYNRPLILIFVDFRKTFDTAELSEILAAYKEVESTKNTATSLRTLTQQ